MKVLQIATGFDVGFNGGITNYVRALGESLVQAGHECVVVDSCRANERTYSFERISIGPTRMRPFDFSSVYENGDLAMVEALLRDARPDVIHVHMMLDLPYRVLELCTEIAPTILSLHDYSWFCKRILYAHKGEVCTGSDAGRKCASCIGRFEGRRRLSRFLGWVPSRGHEELFSRLQGIFPRFHSVMAVSSRVREIYRENGLDHGRFDVVHIGNVTGSPEYHGRFEGKRCTAARKEDVRVGFVGSFNPMKGAELILALAAQIPQTIRIHGRVEPSFREAIEMASNVEYCGAYTQDGLSAIMADIDIGLVLPTWEDNAPQVVFEFLNSRVPVIGTRKGGIPDFVSDGVNGVLVEPTEEGIRKAAGFLLQEDLPGLVRSMAERIVPTKSPGQHGKEMLDRYLAAVQERA